MNLFRPLWFLDIMELQCLQYCFSLHCVRGCYPSSLLKAWDQYDQEKRSENDRPGKIIFPENTLVHKYKCHMFRHSFNMNINIQSLIWISWLCFCIDFFGKEQLFLILEFEFGGSDLESMNGKVHAAAFTPGFGVLKNLYLFKIVVAIKSLHYHHGHECYGNAGLLLISLNSFSLDYYFNGAGRSKICCYD